MARRLGLWMVVLSLASPLCADDYGDYLRAQAAIRAQNQRNYEAQLRAQAAVRAQNQRNYEAQLRAEAAVRAQNQRNYEAQLRAEAAIRAQNRSSSSYPSYSYPSSSHSYQTGTGTYVIPQYSRSYEPEIIPTPPPVQVAQRQPTSKVSTDIRIKIPRGASLYIDGRRVEGEAFSAPGLERGKRYFYLVEVEMIHDGAKYRKAFELSFYPGNNVELSVSLDDVLRAKAEAGFGDSSNSTRPEEKVPALPKNEPAPLGDGWLPIPEGVVAIGGKRIEKGADAYKLNPDGSVTWRTPFAKNLREWEAAANETLNKLAADAKKQNEDDERVDAVYFKAERETASQIGDTALVELAEGVIADEEKKRKEFRAALTEAQAELVKQQLAGLVLEAKSAADEGPSKESDHLGRAKSLAEKWNQSWLPFKEKWDAEKTRRADDYRPMAEAHLAAKQYLDWETRSQKQDQNWFDAAKKKYVSDLEATDTAFFAAEKEKIQKLPTEEMRTAATEALEKERDARAAYRKTVLDRLTEDLQKRRAFTRSELLTVLGAYFRRKPNFHESHKRRFAEETKRLETFDKESETQWGVEQKRQKEQYRTAQSRLDALTPKEVALPDSCKDSPYALRDDKNGSFSLGYVEDDKRTEIASFRAKSVAVSCHSGTIAVVADALSVKGDFVQLKNEVDPDAFAKELTQGRFGLFQDGKLVFAWEVSPLRLSRVDWDTEAERFVLRLEKDGKAFTDHMYEIRDDGSDFKRRLGRSKLTEQGES
ncbi:MAG: hypothetical protein R3B54_10215 [Bdellovibrionota bacterium]